MSRQINFRQGTLLLFALFALTPAFGRVKLSRLAEKLLYGSDSSRAGAIDEFNKLTAQQQHDLVPDFLVAMSDDDPGTRKIASRILKALGVKVETEIPDARKELTPEEAGKKSADPWSEEKKLRNEPGMDKWGDLKRMREEENGGYQGMKKELESEKNDPVWIDAAQLASDTTDRSSPISTVSQSLKDPNPWVRAQAARRLGTLRPAPVEAIPDLIKMMEENIPESRRAAAAALGSFGPLAIEAIPVLNTALSDPDPAVRDIAKEALQQIRQRP